MPSLVDWSELLTPTGSRPHLVPAVFLADRVRVLVCDIFETVRLNPSVIFFILPPMLHRLLMWFSGVLRVVFCARLCAPILGGVM